MARLEWFIVFNISDYGPIQLHNVLYSLLYYFPAVPHCAFH